MNHASKITIRIYEILRNLDVSKSPLRMIKTKTILVKDFNTFSYA